MTTEQREAVLVLTMGHLCTMASELTQDANRLTHALARRG
jgi:hypothetical protein